MLLDGREPMVIIMLIRERSDARCTKGTLLIKDCDVEV